MHYAINSFGAQRFLSWDLGAFRVIIVLGKFNARVDEQQGFFLRDVRYDAGKARRIEAARLESNAKAGKQIAHIHNNGEHRKIDRNLLIRGSRLRYAGSPQ